MVLLVAGKCSLWQKKKTVWRKFATLNGFWCTHAFCSLCQQSQILAAHWDKSFRDRIKISNLGKSHSQATAPPHPKKPVGLGIWFRCLPDTPQCCVPDTTKQHEASGITYDLDCLKDVLGTPCCPSGETKGSGRGEGKLDVYPYNQDKRKKIVSWMVYWVLEPFHSNCMFHYMYSLMHTL